MLSQQEMEEMFNQKHDENWLRNKLIEEKEKNPWKIAPDGDVVYYEPNGIISYYIKQNCLHQRDWIEHVLEKTWVNMNDFLKTYVMALNRNGYQINITKIEENKTQQT